MVDDSPKTVNSFLQSAEWEDFQKRLGRKTWRVGKTLLVRHDLPMAQNYLYSPHAVLSDASFFGDAAGIAAKEGSVFLKIDPWGKIYVPQPYKFQISNSLQPQKTLILDLLPQEHEILSHTHPKTRYNIRLAEKHGVAVRRGAAEDFEKFFALLKTTAGRDQFYIHDENHYKKLIAARSERFSNEIFLAEYQGKVLAAALVTFYRESGFATYLHGASSREHKEVMAPYLLHWEIIFEAKARGFHYYDLWGIDEKRWPGVTRFKMGFGGEVFEHPPSIDVVYHRGWYAAYKLVKMFRQ